MTSRYFAAFCRPVPGEACRSRFGLTVPRAVGKAVDRNRLKRRMREAIRTQLALAAANWKIVFNPRRSALDADFKDLCAEIGRIFSKCKQL
jgi:ribonuclease P protein component